MKREPPTTLAAAPSLGHAPVRFCGQPGVHLQYTVGDIQPHLLGSCLGQSDMWAFAVLSDYQVAAILRAR